MDSTVIDFSLPNTKTSSDMKMKMVSCFSVLLEVLTWYIYMSFFFFLCFSNETFYSTSSSNIYRKQNLYLQGELYFSLFEEQGICDNLWVSGS